MTSLLPEFLDTPSDFSGLPTRPIDNGLEDLGREINPSKVLLRADGTLAPPKLVAPAVVDGGFDFEADVPEVDPSSLLAVSTTVSVIEDEPAEPAKPITAIAKPGYTAYKIDTPALPKYKPEDLPGQIFVGDCIESMRRFPDNSIDCVCTSPPYFRLRDYGVDGQIGLENSPDEYIGRIIALFDEIHRALKPTGTVWVNLGDSYAGDSRSSPTKSIGEGRIFVPGQSVNVVQYMSDKLRDGCLIGIPWRFALAMQDKWVLRQDIIWAKRNCIPESIRTRFCKSHEHIFMFVKGKGYYFDYEKARENALEDVRISGSAAQEEITDERRKELTEERGRWVGDGKRLKRDVWFVTTNAAKGQKGHVAPYPERLLINCIEPGCPPGGLVLDPFMGSGTTGAVAQKLGRKWVGCELNQVWADAAKKRIIGEETLFDME